MNERRNPLASLKKPLEKASGNYDYVEGVCPACSNRMQIASCAGANVWVCTRDKIAIPVAISDPSLQKNWKLGVTQ